MSFFLLTIVLYSIEIKASDYPFCIFKLLNCISSAIIFFILFFFNADFEISSDPFVNQIDNTKILFENICISTQNKIFNEHTIVNKIKRQIYKNIRLTLNMDDIIINADSRSTTYGIKTGLINFSSPHCSNIHFM